MVMIKHHQNASGFCVARPEFRGFARVLRSEKKKKEDRDKDEQWAKSAQQTAVCAAAGAVVGAAVGGPMGAFAGAKAENNKKKTASQIGRKRFFILDIINKYACVVWILHTCIVISIGTIWIYWPVILKTHATLLLSSISSARSCLSITIYFHTCIIIHCCSLSHRYLAIKCIGCSWYCIRRYDFNNCEKSQRIRYLRSEEKKCRVHRNRWRMINENLIDQEEGVIEWTSWVLDVASWLHFFTSTLLFQ